MPKWQKVRRAKISAAEAENIFMTKKAEKGTPCEEVGIYILFKCVF